MKQFLAVIVLSMFAISVHAQSLTLSDITNLASLNSSEAHNSLTFERPFQQKYTEKVNGSTIDHYQGNTPASKSETVTINYEPKTALGASLNTVTYNTTNIKYLHNLIAQAKSIGLTKQFQGADRNNNIYLFSNFLYTVNIYIANDNSKGFIMVRENEMSEVGGE
jgi:hypothetical protein